MNFDLISQISKIIGRQITNFSKKFTRILMIAAKPFVYLNTYVRTQIKSMTRAPTSKEDYVRLFGVYLSKQFLAMRVIVTVAAVTIFSTIIYPWMEGRFWTPVIRLNSTKMATYTGPARIRNDTGVIIYNGDVVSGQLTGSASQYNTEGELVYTGEFKNAKYEGYGTLYLDGIVRYEGYFSDNLYNGEGRLYNERGALIYQGGFAKGLRSGKGMEYRPLTHTLSYYGDFVNDLREGSGVAYEEDGVTVQYRGSYLAGFREGEGSYYENGKLVYQGQFSQDLYEGSGTLYDADGTILYQGEFSQGSRQGAGTVYDPIGAALFSGLFLDDNVNFIGYLAAGPEDIIAAFGTPGYTVQEGDYRILTYLNLGTSFLCRENEEGGFVCEKILVNVDQDFLGIHSDSTQEDIDGILGERFSTLTLPLSAERSTASSLMTLELPESGRSDKYLFSTYYIKLFYDVSGEFPLAVEVGSF